LLKLESQAAFSMVYFKDMIYVMDDSNNLILFNFTQGAWRYIETSYTILSDFEKVYAIALIDIDVSIEKHSWWYWMLIIGSPIIGFLVIVIVALAIRYHHYINLLSKIVLEEDINLIIVVTVSYLLSVTITLQSM
jgi:hypothetical protein